MVDVVRIPNASTFRFFQGRPDVLTPVRWYRVPWDRETLGIQTVFCSSIWDDVKQDQPLGEVNKLNRWSSGAPAQILLAGPPGRCGKPEQWLKGVKVGDPAPDIDPNTGAPVCCPNVVIQCEGGIVEGVDPQLGALGEADALAAQKCFAVWQLLAEADGMQAQVCWHAWEELPEADGMTALLTPPPPSAELPEADGMHALVTPPVVSADLPEADGMVSVATPPPVSADLPEADGADAVTTHGGGDVAPGATCLTAATITLPFTTTRPIVHGTEHWWKFAGAAATRYKITLTVNSGNIGSVRLSIGTCASDTELALVNGFAPGCASGLTTGAGTCFVRVITDGFSDGNYTLAVGTGPC